MNFKRSRTLPTPQASSYTYSVVATTVNGDNYALYGGNSATTVPRIVYTPKVFSDRPTVRWDDTIVPYSIEDLSQRLTFDSLTTNPQVVRVSMDGDRGLYVSINTRRSKVPPSYDFLAVPIPTTIPMQATNYEANIAVSCELNCEGLDTNFAILLVHLIANQSTIRVTSAEFVADYRTVDFKNSLGTNSASYHQFMSYYSSSNWNPEFQATAGIAEVSEALLASDDFVEDIEAISADTANAIVKDNSRRYSSC